MPNPRADPVREAGERMTGITLDAAGWVVPAACLSTAAAVGFLVCWFLRPLAGSSEQGYYEAMRQHSMRNESWVYRLFRTPVMSVAGALKPGMDAADARLQRALRSQRRWQDWNSREFIATKIVEGVFVGGTVLVLVSSTGVWSLAVLLGGVLVVVYPFLSQQSVLSKFESRTKRQRLRLPFVIDQIALMMQAGATFEDSLRSIAMEDPDHPLTEELRTVLADITAGRPRRSALGQWKSRVPDPDVGELISSIVKGEELGTPLSTILAEQADQMRVKRSQWGEKAAAEAEVQIVFPGMLVMIACLIVVLGPIMLPAIMNLTGTGD